MRKIKFRAWDKENRVMVYSDDNTNDDFAFIVEEEGGLHFYYIDADRYLTDTNSINMQYTGLKDKNGREIYEGDIVDNSYFNPLNGKGVIQRYKVEWCKGFYTMRFIWNRNGNDRPLFTKNEHISVIGNIYENPELLDGEDKQ